MRPLQNRVTPLGEIVVNPARGLYMGNRGGRLHDPQTQRLSNRRWVSKAWIYCRLSFKGRRRQVMGAGYTALFFRDAWTALATGHRPCFECQRDIAARFSAAWARAFSLKAPPLAGVMDAALHEERLAGREKRFHRLSVDDGPPPTGSMLVVDGAVKVVDGGHLRPWSWEGYGVKEPMPRDFSAAITLITPPSICATLRAFEASGEALQADGRIGDGESASRISGRGLRAKDTA